MLYPRMDEDDHKENPYTPTKPDSFFLGTLINVTWLGHTRESDFAALIPTPIA